VLAAIPVELPDLQPAPDGGVYKTGATITSGGRETAALAGGMESWQSLWAPTSGAFSDDGGANFLLGARGGERATRQGRRPVVRSWAASAVSPSMSPRAWRARS
jgi:hypothetical protein